MTNTGSSGWIESRCVMPDYSTLALPLSPQDPLHRARGHAEPVVPCHVRRHAPTHPRRPRQGHAHDQMLDVQRNLARSAWPRLVPSWVQAIRTIALEPLPPPIEHCARDAGLLAGQRGALQFLGALHDMQAHREYAVVRVIPFSSHSRSLGRVQTLGRIGRMALVSFHRCRHYYESGQPRPRVPVFFPRRNAGSSESF
jgi:hypothetical protein